MNQKGQTLIIGIMVGLLIAVGLFGAYYLGTLKSQPQVQTQNPVITSNNTLLQQANSASPSPQNPTLTLPVQKISMSYGIDGCGTAPNTVPQIAEFMSIPNELIDSLAAYGAQGCSESPHILLGPKNWTGTGSEGADGNLGIDLYPTGGSRNAGPHLFLYEVPACVGCIYDAAAPFFPEAKAERDKDYLPSTVQTQIPAGLKIQQVSPELVKYSLPNTPDGLEVSGVAYLGHYPNMQGQPYFYQMEITLSPSEHDLTIAILNSFIQKEGLNK